MIRFKLRNLDDVRNPPEGQVRVVPDLNELFWQISSDGTRIPFGKGVSNNTFVQSAIPVITDTNNVPPAGDGYVNVYIYNDVLTYTDSDGDSVPFGGVLEVSTFTVDGGDATTDFTTNSHLRIDFGASA